MAEIEGGVTGKQPEKTVWSQGVLYLNKTYPVGF